MIICNSLNNIEFLFSTEWRTTLIHGLNANNVHNVAIIINWGLLSCQNYDCLVSRTTEPMGKVLGEFFRKKFDPSKLTLVGQSLAGQRIYLNNTNVFIKIVS